MEQQFLNKLSDSLDKVIEKLDKQTIQIQDLTNKVDFYREAQTEQARKLDATEKIAADAMASTKAAHKRQDSFERSVKDLEMQIKDYMESQETKEKKAAENREQERKEREKERKDNATWLKRAIITAVFGWTGLIIAAIIKFIGG